MKKDDSDIPMEDPAIKLISTQYEKKIYDLQQLLEISRSLCSTLEFSTLIESILYICMCQMRVLEAGIFVIEALDSDVFVLGNNYSGMDLDMSVDYRIPADHPLIQEISKTCSVYTLDELRNALPSDTDLKAITTLKPSLIVPLEQKKHLNGLLLLGERIDVGEGTGFSDYEKQQIQGIASLASIAINNAVLLERSSTDMMTHLKLKYYFFNVLTDKLDTALSQNLPLSVLMFDIDFFKKFNDTYGHECGDYVLKTVAKIIREGIRSQDLASRYGGEEFTVMLPATARKEAVAVAERIRSAIEAYDFTFKDQHMKVTISIGVSQFDTDKNPVSAPKQLVDQADQALYVSKRTGRNKVTFADPAVLAQAAAGTKDAEAAAQKAAEER